MSTFVTTDQTVLAIVQGMHHRKMIGYRDRYFMAGAIRTINERITWKQWRDDGCLPFDFSPIEDILSRAPEVVEGAHPLKPWEIENLAWELAVDANHQEVNWKKDRIFTDEEIWASCNCWLKQVGAGAGLSFDYITIIAGVKKLKQDIEREHIHDKTWKARCWFGNWHFFTKDEDGEWVDIEKTIPSEIAA